MTSQQKASQCRAANHRDIENGYAETHRIGKVARRHQRRHQRLAGRSVERGGCGSDCGQEIDWPNVSQSRERRNRETSSARKHQRLHDDHQPLAIHCIRDDATKNATLRVHPGMKFSASKLELEVRSIDKDGVVLAVSRPK